MGYGFFVVLCNGCFSLHQYDLRWRMAYRQCFTKIQTHQHWFCAPLASLFQTLDIADYNLHNSIRYDVHNILVLRSLGWKNKTNN